MNKKVGFSLSGIASIVLGIVCFFLDVGRNVDYESYGGDAYTGIQQAAAKTANNILHLSVIVKCGFGFLLIVAGLVLIAVAVSQKNNEKTQVLVPMTKGTIVNNTESPNTTIEQVEKEDVPAVEIDYVGTIKKYQKMVENGEMTQEEMDKRVQSL